MKTLLKMIRRVSITPFDTNQLILNVKGFKAKIKNVCLATCLDFGNSIRPRFFSIPLCTCRSEHACSKFKRKKENNISRSDVKRI